MSEHFSFANIIPLPDRCVVLIKQHDAQVCFRPHYFIARCRNADKPLQKHLRGLFRKFIQTAAQNLHIQFLHLRDPLTPVCTTKQFLDEPWEMVSGKFTAGLKLLQFVVLGSLGKCSHPRQILVHTVYMVSGHFRPYVLEIKLLLQPVQSTPVHYSCLTSISTWHTLDQGQEITDSNSDRNNYFVHAKKRLQGVINWSKNKRVAFILLLSVDQGYKND